jgi:hypothetical protein
MEATKAHICTVQNMGTYAIGEAVHSVNDHLRPSFYCSVVWIPIRIRGSMPLTNGSGSGSIYFHH